MLAVYIQLDIIFFCLFSGVFSSSVYLYAYLIQMNKSNFQIHSRYISTENIKLSWLTDTNYECMFRRKLSIII